MKFRGPAAIFLRVTFSLYYDLVDKEEHELSDVVIGSIERGSEYSDCKLYQTVFQAASICLPWNFLAITDIIDFTS